MPKKSTNTNGKLCLVLLWVIWPAGLIWFLVDEKLRKDSFVKYHFKQWLAAAIFMLAGTMIAGVLTFVLIGLLLYPVIFVLGIIWFIQALVYILGDEKKDLLLIGKYAKKFDF